jgi:hypothetical protein
MTFENWVERVIKVQESKKRKYIIMKSYLVKDIFLVEGSINRKFFKKCLFGRFFVTIFKEIKIKIAIFLN